MKIILRLNIIAIGLVVVCVCSWCGAVPVDGIYKGPRKQIFVQEWEQVWASDANIAVMSKEQIIAEAQKGLEAQKILKSWEAEYHVTSRQFPLETMPVHEVITKSQVRWISDGTKWLFENLEKVVNRTTNGSYDSNQRIASNGKVISMIWLNSKEATVQSKDKFSCASTTATITDFLPSLPVEPSSPEEASFPKVYEILGASDTKLLPWYTRVGGNICYVLEHTATEQQPVFKSQEEVENWVRMNPEKETQTIEIDPNAKPGEMRVMKTKVRLAIDPATGFSIVRWAIGFRTESSNFIIANFPNAEITYEDFGEVAGDVYIPWQMSFKIFQGPEQVGREEYLELRKFTVNKQYEPELFELDFPTGYNVIDGERGIYYTVGDSNEKIDALLAGAKAKKEFYDKLSGQQAPALEASGWLNTERIGLAEKKGREIILHYWSIGCAPCMAELGRLQQLYGRTLELTSGPLFISIHPFAEGENLSQLKDTIDKYGIAFPVMMDSPGAERPFFGKTSQKYRIDAVPAEVSIDKNGYFAGIDSGLVSATSSWVERKDFENPITKEK